MISIYFFAAFWFLAAILFTIIVDRLKIFRTILTLSGLSYKIIIQQQYSYIVGVVIAIAVIPILITNKFLLPKHLLEAPTFDDEIHE